MEAMANVNSMWALWQLQRKVFHLFIYLFLHWTTRILVTIKSMLSPADL